MSITSTATVEDASISFIDTDTFQSGTTQTARLIHTQNLELDFTLTQIEVQCTAATGLSGASPGIIRVYQSTASAGAAILQITGVGTFGSSISLDIDQAQGSTRTMIVDAFDPDNGSPNNTCSITGSIVIHGRPLVATAGGSTA